MDERSKEARLQAVQESRRNRRVNDAFTIVQRIIFVERFERQVTAAENLEIEEGDMSKTVELQNNDRLLYENIKVFFDPPALIEDGVLSKEWENYQPGKEYDLQNFVKFCKNVLFYLANSKKITAGGTLA